MDIDPSEMRAVAHRFDQVEIDGVRTVVRGVGVYGFSRLALAVDRFAEAMHERVSGAQSDVTWLRDGLRGAARDYEDTDVSVFERIRELGYWAGR